MNYVSLYVLKMKYHTPDCVVCTVFSQDRNKPADSAQKSFTPYLFGGDIEQFDDRLFPGQLHVDPPSFAVTFISRQTCCRDLKTRYVIKPHTRFKNTKKRPGGANILTASVVSFWTWSTMSDLRGEMTTVIPGDMHAGSW